MTGQGRWGESPIPFGRLEEMFEEWTRTLRANRPHGSVWAQATRGDAPRQDDVVVEDPVTDGGIAVDEYRDGDTRVVRAVLPGVDPERDVEITIADGALTISAERRAQPGDDDRDYVRREIRTGSAARSLPVPEHADESRISASYVDGILEIRIPVTPPPTTGPTRITVSRG